MTITPPVSFETSRLILRAARREHAAPLFGEYTGREDAAHYLLRRAHPSLARTLAVIEACGEENWFATRRFAWAVLRRSDAQVIGLFLLFIDGEGAEIHYGIGSDHWRQGFATEAGMAVMNWVAGKSSLSEVSTCCAAEHAASLRVLDKIGLKRIELLPAYLLLPRTGDKVDGWLYRWSRSDAQD